MRLPRSSRKKAPIESAFNRPIEQPINPDLAELRRYARQVVEHLHAQGVVALDLAARQRSFEWCQAMTQLGGAYNEASISYLALCERFGYLPDPMTAPAPPDPN